MVVGLGVVWSCVLQDGDFFALVGGRWLGVLGGGVGVASGQFCCFWHFLWSPAPGTLYPPPLRGLPLAIASVLEDQVLGGWA